MPSGRLLPESLPSTFNGGEEFLKSFSLWPDKGLADLTPFAYLLFLLWLVARGPGFLAIDRIIAWAWCRRCTGGPETAAPSAP